MADESFAPATGGWRLALAILGPVLGALAAYLLVTQYGSPLIAVIVAAVFAGGPGLWALFALKDELGTLREGVRVLAGGDFGRAVPQVDEPLLAGLAGELEGVRRAARQDLQATRSLNAEQGRAIGDVTRRTEELARGVAAKMESLDQTASSLLELTTSLRAIAEGVEKLAQAAQESSSSILEMGAANDEVSENMFNLAASVQQSASSIEEMTFSIKQVAKNVEALSAIAEETASSMNEMDISIHQVEDNANETARLSEEVTRAATSGVEAINQVLRGIKRIKDSSEEAVLVIGRLGDKIGEIGKILNVIDDVAEQTNLLALNAAIIAAQAGEHGKGFAVVADEIKDLAERSGASTKEIADLIKAVQAESKNAIGAVQEGAHSVDEGVRVSHDAEDALRRIQDSALRQAQMVQEIARATVEQARGSKQVTDAIGTIASTVQQIASATSEQAKGSEQIMKSAEKMRMITKHVERSSQEQGRGSKQITRAIESISEMVGQLANAHREQSRAGEIILQSVEAMRTIGRGQQTNVTEIRRVLEQAQKAQVVGGGSGPAA